VACNDAGIDRFGVVFLVERGQKGRLYQFGQARARAERLRSEGGGLDDMTGNVRFPLGRRCQNGR
jgi:hypothetical protein